MGSTRPASRGKLGTPLPSLCACSLQLASVRWVGWGSGAGCHLVQLGRAAQPELTTRAVPTPGGLLARTLQTPHSSSVVGFRGRGR